MSTWLLLFLLLVLALAIGARWLFRQRNPEEIRAARERLRRLKGKS